ncbi:hypothetical protein GDO86_002548 [Hymenochirus boettgeri]|uniref:Uncharacterized protein n=1 Tax=Hymenochirus boettgeri TaxID=247094 RepID=A0A8T2KMZ5_9PIPI|nr:hypothetical protein GDO86_002548 [Hymenochirus boettgeri]
MIQHGVRAIESKNKQKETNTLEEIQPYPATQMSNAWPSSWLTRFHSLLWKSNRVLRAPWVTNDYVGQNGFHRRGFVYTGLLLVYSALSLYVMGSSNKSKTHKTSGSINTLL